MKGVVLAGGRGLRLHPLTKVTNKHLLPVGKEPMIFNPIRKLVEADINDILIVSDADQMGPIVNVLGGGSLFNCNFTYKAQEAPLGIAHALSLAKDFVGNDKVVVVLGDNVTTGSIKPFVENFAKQPKGARVLLKEVDNPSRFGIAAIDERHIISIEEKPKQPKTKHAVIGYYMYDSQIFDIIKSMPPSARGEYEITDVNNVYVKKGELEYDVLEAEWTDAGTFESLLLANQMFLKAGDVETSGTPVGVAKEQLMDMMKFHQTKMSELQKYLK